MSAAHTPGPWRACHNGKCSCGQIWSAEYPVAAVTVGKWGDEYPSLRIIGTSVDAKAEAYMERMVYGEVSASVAEANASLIAAAPLLLAEMRRFLPLLERLEDSALWADLTAGLGIATINSYRAAIAAATGENRHE